MIELPEAQVLAKQINRMLIGKRIKQVTANHSPHKFAWYSGDPATYNGLLAGKMICSAAAYAGEVEITADDHVLMLNASLRYHLAKESLPRKHQLLLEFEDGTALTATVQRWGGLFCITQKKLVDLENNDDRWKRPSPLSDAFDLTYFYGLFDKDTCKLSAKTFMTTEQRIPGLGNGVLQDILWSARIHPKRKVITFYAEEIVQLYNAVKFVLRSMTIQGGRDTERDLFGCPGSYKTILSKYTIGHPCPACGATIKKEMYAGGAIYFCECCQRL